MKSKFKNIKSENGYVLVTTLIAIIFISLIGAALLRLAYSDYMNTNFYVRHRQAYYIARAGAGAVSQWIKDSDNDVDDLISDGETISSEPVNFGEGTYLITLNRNGNTFEIISNGKVNNIEKSIKVVLKKEDSFSIDHTVFADQGLSIGNIFSGNNDYSDLELIFGTNLIAGSEDVDIHNGVENYIDIEYDLNFTYELPDFPEDNFDTTYNTLDSDYLHSYNFSDNRFDYDSLSLKNKETLTIDIYGSEDFNIYLNELDIAGDIVVNRSGDGGVLNIFVKEDFKTNGNFAINEDGAVEDVNIYHYGSNKIHPAANSTIKASIYTKSTDIDFTGNSVVYGNLFAYQSGSIKFAGNGSNNQNIIYAPHSDATLTGNSDFYGAIIANTVDIKGSAMISGDPDNITLPTTVGSDYDMTWSDV